MAVVTVDGIYENGRVKLAKRPKGVERARVRVTFLSDVEGEAEQQITNAFGARLPGVTIPPGRERLEIQYTSLNFSAPENVRFKYRLDNYESHWIEAGNNRVAAYSQLPPGNYTFRVIAYNEDGVMNPDGASLAVIVLPAFWQKTSFRIFLGVVVLGLIGGLIYYFSTQKLQRELAVLKQHEELEKERARIARDLHDQLGANLTQVSLLGELAEDRTEQILINMEPAAQQGVVELLEHREQSAAVAIAADVAGDQPWVALAQG